MQGKQTHLEDEAGEGEERRGVDARCGGDGRGACLAQPQQGHLQQAAHLYEQAAQLQHRPRVCSHLRVHPRHMLRIANFDLGLVKRIPSGDWSLAIILGRALTAYICLED